MSEQERSEQKQYQFFKDQLTYDSSLIYAGALLQRAAQLFPAVTAVIISEEMQLSYAQLYADASKITHFVRTHGLQTRERCIILYENSIEFYQIYWGIWQAGAIVVPVNTFLHEQEIAHIIHDAQPTYIFASETLAKKLPANLPASIKVIAPQQIVQILQGPAQSCTLHELGRDEMAALLYTSGTTGVPKGVMLSSNNIVINSLQGAARFEFNGQERLFCPLPLFHSFPQNTCMWAATIFGATVILVPTITRSALVAGLALKPTIVLGVPGLYALFCKMRGISFDSARYIVSGGDALLDKVSMYFELIYGRKICNGYGLSETGPFVAADFDDVMEPTSTVGKPLVHIAYEIRDVQEDGTKKVGILWLKGPNIMLGYYQAPEATAKVLHDGWFNTGDLATISAEGKIIICGREKDLISNKGRKIYPQELENLLMAHNNVLMAAVIGVRDGAEGEEYPVAYIVFKKPVQDAAAVLHNYCTQHIALYKIPRNYIIVESLPLTPTGKIDKKELRKKH